MNKQNVMNHVQDIFRDVLDNDEIELSDTTTVSDIDEWDSLTHIQLIIAIEKKFNKRISTQQVMEWKNVGEMINFIVAK